MAKIYTAFFSIIMLLSCNSNTIFSESKTLSGSWNKDEKITFNFQQLDSLAFYNIFINIRNTNDYKYNNIFLIAEINFPHGKTIIDTLEYRMAAPDGTWLGQGIGNVKENKLWYKEHIRFFEDGNYTLKISQAVRNNGEVRGVTNLEGITDVGYSIEKSQQYKNE